uniref:C-type natriuretic peptide 3 n=2 Tax=Oncorhynchus tshawytscha TaxID=74940 RepID=A0A8C8LR77_ONCTS
MFSWASVTKRHRYKCAPGDVLLPKENSQGERFGLPTEQRGEDKLHMKMISNITFGCLSALVLLNLVGAYPVSNLQRVIRLLEEERNVPYNVSEEREVDGKELNTEKAAFTAGVVSPWDSEDARNSALAGKENAIARLLNYILKTSKHPWSRFKKGGMRSCFGVRLERIGSFSGLGC